MKTLIVILISSMLVLGCVSNPVKPGPECDGSLYAKNPDAVEFTLKAFVSAALVSAMYDKRIYMLTHKASELIVASLEGNTVERLDQIKLVNSETQRVLAVLITLWAPNQPLHPCDRQVIVRYLKMI